MSRNFLPNPGFRATQALMNLPLPLVRRINGEPVVIDGQALDPYVQLMLASADRIPGVSGIGESSEDIATRRAQNVAAARLGMPRATRVHTVDRDIPGPAGPLPIRIYRADDAPARPPALVYFHGGGWVVGSLDSHDGDCRMLARITGAVVVAVDYRLAPEHPYPAAPDDATAAFEWVSKNSADLGTQPGRVAVMGDSAGANLAIVVATRARDGGSVPPPIAQALVYPATDMRLTSLSHELFDTGFFLTHDDMVWFRDHYLPPGMDLEHPEVSPLLAPRVAGLPPTRIWTAGFDPLRDEGEAYAERLRAAGVPVQLRREPAMIHGFFGMGVIRGGLQRIARVCWDTAALLRTASGN